MMENFDIRVEKESGQDRYYQDGVKAFNYTVEAQTETVAFYYRDVSDCAPYNILERSKEDLDHYQKGFVLRSLHLIDPIIDK